MKEELELVVCADNGEFDYAIYHGHKVTVTGCGGSCSIHNFILPKPFQYSKEFSFLSFRVGVPCEVMIHDITSLLYFRKETMHSWYELTIAYEDPADNVVIRVTDCGDHILAEHLS